MGIGDYAAAEKRARDLKRPLSTLNLDGERPTSRARSLKRKSTTSLL